MGVRICLLLPGFGGIFEVKRSGKRKREFEGQDEKIGDNEAGLRIREEEGEGQNNTGSQKASPSI